MLSTLIMTRLYMLTHLLSNTPSHYDSERLIPLNVLTDQWSSLLSSTRSCRLLKGPSKRGGVPKLELLVNKPGVTLIQCATET